MQATLSWPKYLHAFTRASSGLEGTARPAWASLKYECILSVRQLTKKEGAMENQELSKAAPATRKRAQREGVDPAQ